MNKLRSCRAMYEPRQRDMMAQNCRPGWHGELRTACGIALPSSSGDRLLRSSGDCDLL